MRWPVVFAVSFVSLAACVGDDPLPATSSGNADSGSSAAADATTGDAGGAVDASGCACSNGETCFEGVCDGKRVIAIGTGGFHVCALRKSGTVACWGSNANAQLGRTQTASHAVPAVVEGLDDVVEVAAGKKHTCARRRNKSVWCWGDNASGQLGHTGNDQACSGTPCNSVPMRIDGLNADAIAVGKSTSCALIGGKVACWGLNADGLFGPTASVTQSVTPIFVSGVENARSIFMGTEADIACAVRLDGKVLCWGNNRFGAVGRDENDASCTGRNCPTPNLVGAPTGINGVSSVAIGDNAVCALTQGEAAYCWGNNTYGQLAGGTFDSGFHSSPTRSNALQRVAPAGSYRAFCGIDRGEVTCWGEETYGASAKAPGSQLCGNIPCSATPAKVAGLNEVIALGGGIHWFAALRSNGEVWTWGINASEQLGHARGTDGDATCIGNEGNFPCNAAPSRVAGLD